MRNTTLASLGVASLIGLFSSSGGALSNAVDVSTKAGNAQANGVDKSLPSRTTSTNKSIQSLRGMTGVITYGDKRPGGPGWSNRQVQRMARKRRAVKSNRKNHR